MRPAAVNQISMISMMSKNLKETQTMKKFQT